MSLREPDWDLWRAFHAVMEGGTLSAAARDLGATQPTLGRQIDALEQALGYPLFVRGPRGLVPTQAAEALAPIARTLAATAGALTRAAGGAGQGEQGIVRISASAIVAAEVLPPILTRFRLQHPGIEVELAASNELADLAAREADIAVRMTAPTGKALLAKKLAELKLHLFAHDNYLAARGTPRTIDELKGHTIIGYDRDTSLLSGLRARGIMVTVRDFGFRTDNDLTQLALLRAGAGIGGMQVLLARKHPELKPVLTDKVFMNLDMWLVMHEDLKAARPVRLMFDHLDKSLSAYAKGKPLA